MFFDKSSEFNPDATMIVGREHLKLDEYQIAGRSKLNAALNKGDPDPAMVHPAMIHQWQKAPLDGAADIFKRGGRKPVAEVDALDMSRLWRSLKYECVYLHAWDTESQAKSAIGRWIIFYNHRRPHTIRRQTVPGAVF